TLGYSALQTGLALLPLAIGSFCASGASFSLTASVSALGQVRVGLALEAVGLVLLGLFAAADSAWWSIAIALFIYGIGIGLATAGLPDQQVEQFGAAITDSAGSAVPALAADPATEPIAAAGREAMSSAVELSSYLCAALLAAALLATLFMRPARATRPD